MNKIAFLVPIYPPHFIHAKRLEDSLKRQQLDKQADLWFVFTNEAEKEEFGQYDNSIILPEKLRNFEKNGIINIKKFYGLNELKNKYKYIIVLDAESLFIKNVDLENVCNDFWNKKVLYGNELPGGGELEVINTIKTFCKKNFPEFNNNIENDDLYLWFNQPCIYRTDTLDEFFNIISYKEKAADFSTYDFDYYIYMYYLILYKGFRIEDLEIESNCGAFEASFDPLYFKSDKYRQCDIYMCSEVNLLKFDNPKLFIICHLDRNVFGLVRILTRRIEKLEKSLEKQKFKYKFKKFLSMFIPNKELRRKIRGDI